MVPLKMVGRDKRKKDTGHKKKESVRRTTICVLIQKSTKSIKRKRERENNMMGFSTTMLSTIVVGSWMMGVCVGFTIPLQQQQRVSILNAAAVSDASNDRVIKAGGGIPIVPSGDCLLFDPAVEGKLGGSGVLEKRLERGALYEDAFVWQQLEQTQPSDVLVGLVNDDGIADQELKPAQAWLESGTVPTPFAKNNAPVQATVLGRTRLIGPDAPGDIQHILLRLPEGMTYVEGQSLSVIPPGIDAKTGKPHKPRLYSIASTRYGDLLDGNTVSLCVRRAEYHDPVSGLPVPSKAGVCSNFLCDTQPGDQVSVAGPVGKTMLLPSQPDRDIIMVATGTGIAPFRGFLHRLFVENTIARHLYTGSAWLILGVPVTSGLLYKTELDAMQTNGTSKRESKLYKCNCFLLVYTHHVVVVVIVNNKHTQHVLVS